MGSFLYSYSLSPRMQAQLDDRVAPSQLPRRLPYVPAIDGL